MLQACPSLSELVEFEEIGIVGERSHVSIIVLNETLRIDEAEFMRDPDL